MSGVTGALPAPSGPFRIGRTSAHWVDRSRIEPLSPNHEYRELIVDIWYPADASGGSPALYIDTAPFERVLGASGFKEYFGEAFSVIEQGVRTHAMIDAPVAASVKRCPVLIFSPGGGMIRQVYAAQMEALASHGYIVAAISHPYDAILTVLPDGQYIRYDSKRWPATPSAEGEANQTQLEWHARDIRFVLDELTRSQHTTSSTLPVARHLDLEQVGAFGHSFGGHSRSACMSNR